MVVFLFFYTLCYPETLTMASTMVRFPPSTKNMVSFIGECARMRVRLKVPIVKNLHSKHTSATWKALRAACKEVRAAIDAGIEVHLEEYLA